MVASVTQVMMDKLGGPNWCGCCWTRSATFAVSQFQDLDWINGGIRNPTRLASRLLIIRDRPFGFIDIRGLDSRR